ncbi:hypothetical protein BCV72DRAFT_332972 [Rhizopus microsporus var. microsporus]|uniref:Tc1-like transposase DDE domain-containing protein n=1 Tax=Rhizopus microsporus var. microsporus TaxID=86635 RepID=A0A1X0REM7_RHIZD|nr:hypothetical protein BCV72DRAFT_332972 [Rhizopus microsporus var. microsporus]
MNYIVDEEQFHLETLSSHTQYLAQLPVGSRKEFEAMQMEKEAKPSSDVIMRETSEKRNYSRYSDQDKLGIHVGTGQKWAKQYEKVPDGIFEKRRKTGRPRILNEEYKSIILECIDESPSVILDDVMKRLKQIFTELKVSKSTLFDSVKNCCNLSLKKARLRPIDRNSEDKIQERLDWVRKCEKSDIDFTRNYVFLDEPTFHISSKSSMAWSKKGTSAVVTVSKTQTTTAILGAISAEGLIKCSLRLPQHPSSKKRKRGYSIGHISKGTVTRRYTVFSESKVVFLQFL